MAIVNGSAALYFPVADRLKKNDKEPKAKVYDRGRLGCHKRQY